PIALQSAIQLDLSPYPFLFAVTVAASMCFASPQLWSTDTPYLYRVVNRLLQDNKIIDEECISIGIRNIAFSAETGFQLNGKSMKLKGGCIHHDNGLLG
ncbi:hypothetical protein PZH42_30045, partial [Bacteroides cellulosilyticus]